MAFYSFLNFLRMKVLFYAYLVSLKNDVRISVKLWLQLFVNGILVQLTTPNNVLNSLGLDVNYIVLSCQHFCTRSQAMRISLSYKLNWLSVDHNLWYLANVF